ncbi:MAG: response regulator transcription factor [Labilithrix sp.]|nr:response regulator transcription factor [Labilithrix sp.]
MSAQRSAILRAELFRDGFAETTCAIEMTEESVFVITELLPPLDHRVSVELSFPRIFRPLRLSAAVTQIRVSDGPGSPPGFVATFDFADERQRERAREVARRIRPVPGALANRELSVLLVEDNQLIRDTFAYAFERYFKQRSARLRLVQAATAEEAWRLARPDLDLLLVDHTLKASSGTDFVSRLRADTQLGLAFIVGMSGAGRAARQAMLDAGADLFLAKPIALKDLFCTLEFLIGAPPWSEYGAA